jgi:hypothetical protein
VGIHCADHATPSIRKSWLTSQTSGGRSVGIVCLWAKVMEFFVCLYSFNHDTIMARTLMQMGIKKRRTLDSVVLLCVVCNG